MNTLEVVHSRAMWNLVRPERLHCKLTVSKHVRNCASSDVLILHAASDRMIGYTVQCCIVLCHFIPCANGHIGIIYLHVAMINRVHNYVVSKSTLHDFNINMQNASWHNYIQIHYHHGTPMSLQ